MSFRATYRCERFLIYTFFGYDELSERNIEFEVRVYNKKCRDEEGDVYYSDHTALSMADNFSHLFYMIKERHPEENTILTADEIDELLK